MKRILLLGSTGSIGTQTLDVVRAHPGEFQIIGLSSYSNKILLEKQAAEFKPQYTLLASAVKNPEKELIGLVKNAEYDIVVNAISGFGGLMPAFAACEAGKTMALANKESLVMAGELLMNTARNTGAKILPVDSEPSAIWQILRPYEKSGFKDMDAPSGRSNSVGRPRLGTASGLSLTSPRLGLIVEKIILTASGGPFWGMKRDALQNVSAAKALAHPTWKMGKKVSIDSATLMNKALEIIETSFLFDIPPEKIDVTIHRQSIVHSFVQFVDGNIGAVLSVPDMHIPISHALFYPARPAANFGKVDFSKLNLTFEAPDYGFFEGPRLAYEVLKEGGIMPAVLCMADEIAVAEFLKREISFAGIYDFIKKALDRAKNLPLSIRALCELKERMVI